MRGISHPHSIRTRKWPADALQKREKTAEAAEVVHISLLKALSRLSKLCMAPRLISCSAAVSLMMLC